MVFNRRDKLTLRDRLRQLVPRRGWRRGIDYVGHRVRRLPDTPHRLALGFAGGVRTMLRTAEEVQRGRGEAALMGRKPAAKAPDDEDEE